MRYLLIILLAVPAPAFAACYDTNGDGIADTCTNSRRTLFGGTVTRSRPMNGGPGVAYAQPSRYAVRTYSASTSSYGGYGSSGGYAIQLAPGESLVPGSVRTVASAPAAVASTGCQCAAKIAELEQRIEQLEARYGAKQTSKAPSFSWAGKKAPTFAWSRGTAPSYALAMR